MPVKPPTSEVMGRALDLLLESAHDAEDEMNPRAL